MSGWISLHRKITRNWLWIDKPFSKGQAWIDLLMSANHEDRKVLLKGQLIEIKRGQSARSEVTLSKDWGWSRGKVRTFLKLLENDKMIVQQKNNVTSIISILNYNDLQQTEQQKDSRKTAERQQKDSRLYTNNNDNNDNNDNNGNKKTYSRFAFIESFFLENFNDYPEALEKSIREHMQVRDKQKCSKTERAIKSYLNSLKDLSGGQFLQMIKIVDQSSDNGWKGLFKLKEEGLSYNKTTGRQINESSYSNTDEETFL